MDITILSRENWISTWGQADKLIERNEYFDIEDLDDSDVYEEAERQITQYIIDNKLLISGRNHQYDALGIPVFEGTDKRKLLFRTSMRHWGSIMAHAWNKIKGLKDIEDEDIISALLRRDSEDIPDGAYNYCEFAWSIPDELESQI
jgi:hypothetical protein